jgi:hypothetical protein
MELAITGHPDTADRELDDNHADQELFRSCSAPTSTPSLVAIAYATGKTSCKVKPSCRLPHSEPVRRYAPTMLLSGAAVHDKLTRKLSLRRPRSTPSPHGETHSQPSLCLALLPA